MRHNLLFLMSVIGLLIFSSCGQDHANELQIENELRKEVKVNAYFYDATGSGSVTSRAADKAWEKDDAIGLFMKKAGSVLVQPNLANNVEFKTDGNVSFSCALADKIYFPFNKEKVDFISYYPYSSSLDDLNYVIDVSDQSNLSAIDFMYSDNAKDKNSDSDVINLSFKHQLTKVVFKIVANNSGKKLPGLSAKITNVNTNANFSLIDGTLADKSVSESVSLNVDTNGTVLQAIMIPDNDLTNKNLVIDIDGTTYTYPLNNSTIQSFEKSKHCTYNITLNAGQKSIIESVTATITDWERVSDDITVTEDPSASIPEEGGDSGIIEGNGDATPEDPAPAPDEGGDGTEANPYNITQAIEIASNQKKGDKESNVWIKGYIVGFYSSNTLSSFVNSKDQGVKPITALALSAEEVDFAKTFSVNFSGKYNINSAINLKDHPTNFKKEVTFNGDIAWMNNNLEGSVHGMANVSKAIINGKSYKY